jgi:hypothetical protein
MPGFCKLVEWSIRHRRRAHGGVREITLPGIGNRMSRPPLAA